MSLHHKGRWAITATVTNTPILPTAATTTSATTTATATTGTTFTAIPFCSGMGCNRGTVTNGVVAQVGRDDEYNDDEESYRGRRRSDTPPAVVRMRRVNDEQLEPSIPQDDLPPDAAQTDNTQVFILAILIVACWCLYCCLLLLYCLIHHLYVRGLVLRQ
ncbi:uncharacterized protein LOC123499528 [Portunus trituberculatus]|uniref:uncharacterized protein LOC123499528 n=1 Tax=Portunus trituberculatus TaxID=210409 RepID=UPI001E1CB357|nr:uncharacterized protein LOC123499528 [Portunus trituberculatus]